MDGRTAAFELGDRECYNPTIDLSELEVQAVSVGDQLYPVNLGDRAGLVQLREFVPALNCTPFARTR